MKVTSGSSVLGLLAGLMDSTSMDQLSAAIRDMTTFATDDHKWVISVQLRHNPKREGDATPK